MPKGIPRKEPLVKKERLPIHCAQCETLFTPRRIDNIFCSKECLQDHLHHEKETRNRARYYIFERDQFKCVYCGKSSIEHGVYLVVDHIIPTSEGGDNSVYNVVTACFECNLKKANSILEESVYRRILERNKAWIQNLSPIRKAFIEKVIERIKRNSDMNYEKYKDKRRDHIYGGVFKGEVNN